MLQVYLVILVSGRLRLEMQVQDYQDTLHLVRIKAKGLVSLDIPALATI